MSKMQITGKVREVGRKGPARQLRRQGLVPGIIYGQDEQVAVSVDAKDVIRVMDINGGVNNILSSKIEGDSKERDVMIKDISVHPMTDKIMHIDFLEIDKTKPIKTKVRLEFIGVPIGVKEQGARMTANVKTLKIEALPEDIPPVIEVPVSELESGQIIRVKQLEIDKKLKVLDGPNISILSVTQPKVEVEETEGEEGVVATEEAPAEAPVKE